MSKAERIGEIVAHHASREGPLLPILRDVQAQFGCIDEEAKAAVARALMTRPTIVFGDEPTGNLDSRSSAEVLQFMRTTVDQAAQTVVIVTHDPVAASYTDRVVFMADGRIVDSIESPTTESVIDHMLQFGS